MSGRSSRSTLMLTKCSFIRRRRRRVLERLVRHDVAPVAGAVADRRGGSADPPPGPARTPRRPHGYQSTGLSACWSRYGAVSAARRFRRRPRGRPAVRYAGGPGPRGVEGEFERATGRCSCARRTGLGRRARRARPVRRRPACNVERPETSSERQLEQRRGKITTWTGERISRRRKRGRVVCDELVLRRLVPRPTDDQRRPDDKHRARTATTRLSASAFARPYAVHGDGGSSSTYGAPLRPSKTTSVERWISLAPTAAAARATFSDPSTTISQRAVAVLPVRGMDHHVGASAREERADGGSSRTSTRVPLAAGTSPY